LLDRRHRLISFQDIRDELEQREVDFSQKLIKVLTHEIMNSVTPIIALCKVIEEALLAARDEPRDEGPCDEPRDAAGLCDEPRGAEGLREAPRDTQRLRA